MKERLKQKNRLAEAGFFLVLLISLLPMLLFPVLSVCYHRFHDVPVVSGGVLDMGGYDPAGKAELPLDGEWEFFPDQWIVTDNTPDAVPAALVHVPLAWDWYDLKKEDLPSEGFASYRLHLKNCPEDTGLLVYVPNLGASYRVFIGGELAAQSGKPSKTPERGDITQMLIMKHLGTVQAREADVVIEISSAVTGGLYITPLLSETHGDYLRYAIRHIAASVSVGMLLTLITFCVVSQLFMDQTNHALVLLFLDLVVLCRILMRDEFFGGIKVFAPFFRYYEVNAVLQTVSLFLPVVFLVSAGALAGLDISRKSIRRAAVFEAVCAVPFFILSIRGRFFLQFLLSLISFLPFVMILAGMYGRVRRKEPNALLFSIVLMFVVSSLIGAGMTTTGLLIFNVSLLPTALFVAAMTCHSVLYMRLLLSMRSQAMESSILRLRLRESETSLMLSQIRPHFVYNALIAIQVLCARDPETACEALVHFSKYLRANMRSIDCPEPIPFSMELEHIENYVYIEKLRFQDRLAVELDIGARDFTVPALTIQPLVENAIKHGACKRLSDGKVTLRTRAGEDAYYIYVEDNGPGFDVSILENGRKESYGLRNISFRLREMMGADIRIDSVPEAGTHVTVTLPRPPRTKGAP